MEEEEEEVEAVEEAMGMIHPAVNSATWPCPVGPQLRLRPPAVDPCH